MIPLQPFRAWHLALSRRAEWVELLKSERNSNDRSQFVRFARIAATWMEWLKLGDLFQDEAESLPQIQVGQYTATVGVAMLDNLSATQSVLPKDKEESQRILESLHVFMEPIFVLPNGKVIGQHSLFAAAKGMQEDLNRPGKVRPSDFALVAVLPIESLTELEWQALEITGARLDQFAPDSLPISSTDQGLKLELHVDGSTYLLDWSEKTVEELEKALMIRKLDVSTSKMESDESEAWFQMKFEQPNAFSGLPIEKNLLPKDSFLFPVSYQIGDMMWSPRSFDR